MSDLNAPSDRLLQLALLARSGLFDRAFYLAANADVREAGIDPLEHFFDGGWAENRRPNAIFEPLWYLEQNPDAAGVNPLFHYAQIGEVAGRRPAPWFDPAWYRDAYGVTDALAHYLEHRASNQFSPLREFDMAYYSAQNPDVVAAQIDRFAHFMGSGFQEGRNPSAEFDVRYYARRYLKGDFGQNPLLHYLAQPAGVATRMPEDEASIPREVKYFSKPGPDFEEFRPLPAGTPLQVQLLAYYLPQFHHFPENDEWWGKGFTEWTNLARGLPRFKGHYQPRVPRDLGFYDLDHAEALRCHADLARAGGVQGFIFYYYWFNGKRLMEKPIKALLEDKSIDLPFALLWANENWTRRWDGAEHQVLISQDYRPEDDAAMLAEYARHFRDPRYIRLQDGRPLLIIYRPGIIPDAVAALARWRQMFQQDHGENPIFVMVQAFGDSDPAKYGFDGAIEFPPHKLAAGLPRQNENLTLLDYEFSGEIFSYDDVVARSLAEASPAYPLIRGVMPAWDNDARRQGSGMVIHGSRPAKYEAWLAHIAGYARENPFFGSSLAVVNAWNEWAEGTYLEPDVHFGAAYLNATGRAVAGLRKRAGQGVLLIGHDAHPHGSQELLLNIGRTMVKLGVEIEFLLLEGGPMLPQYTEVANTVVPAAADLRAFLVALRERGFGCALVNTAAASRVVKLARECGIDCVNLIHELPRIIADYKLGPALLEALRYAKALVFPSAFVRDAVLAAVGGNAPVAEILVQPQGVYKPLVRSQAGAARVRAELGLSDQDRFVIGVGYGDLRKGFDLFLQLWRLAEGTNLHFCWLGRVEAKLQQWLQHEIDLALASGRFHLPGFTDDMAGYVSAAAALALTSREDPFPSVALEALSVGTPVVAFERSGGIPDLLAEHRLGAVVPFADGAAMLEAILAIEPDEAAVAARSALIAERFDWDGYVGRLVELARGRLESV